MSKLFWALATPGNLFFLLLIFAVLLLWTRWAASARRILTALVLFGLVVAVVPLGQWLLLPLENRFPNGAKLPPKLDGIVVLGGSINQFITKARGQATLGGGAERLLAAAHLARRYPEAKLVFSGGSGDPFRQNLKEASVARMIFMELGLNRDINTGRILFEDQSRNTHENAILSHKLARPQAGETWVLVTSARHMPRAIGSFRRAGWQPLAYPVDYATDGTLALTFRFNFLGGLAGLAGSLKEWIGLIYYYVLNRTDALFPAPLQR